MDRNASSRSRTPFVGANWKMNGSVASGAAWLESLGSQPGWPPGGVDTVLFPPFTILPLLREAALSAGTALGGQDLFFEPKGAFTGEISAGMLLEAGCSWVLAGHSERRHILGEDLATVGRKVRAAVESGLGVVLCVGERLEERDSGIETEVVEGMLESALAGLDSPDPDRIVIAYEPVWAIGTGRNASPDQASAMHGHIRAFLGRIVPGHFAPRCRIIYGGSVNEGNASSIMTMPDVDGALVGGASLDARAFLRISFAAG